MLERRDRRGGHERRRPDPGRPAAGPACITAERSGHRLKDKRGILVRGPGRSTRDGHTAHVAVDQARLTWWAGEASATVVTAGAVR